MATGKYPNEYYTSKEQEIGFRNDFSDSPEVLTTRVEDLLDWQEQIEKRIEEGIIDTFNTNHEYQYKALSRIAGSLSVYD